jgi:hypothetical protein
MLFEAAAEAIRLHKTAFEQQDVASVVPAVCPATVFPLICHIS